jgi:hypothetical protein
MTKTMVLLRMEVEDLQVVAATGSVLLLRRPWCTSSSMAVAVRCRLSLDESRTGP